MKDFVDGLLLGRKNEIRMDEFKGEWVIEPKYDGSRDFKMVTLR